MSSIACAGLLFDELVGDVGYLCVSGLSIPSGSFAQAAAGVVALHGSSVVGCASFDFLKWSVFRRNVPLAVSTS